MKRDPSSRFPGAAHSSRDALAGTALLAGHPVLARGEAVVAEAGPLGLGCLPAVRGTCRAPLGGSGARSDHVSPEREAFMLPRAALALAGAKEDDVA
jgi:hypothetical protein